MSEVEELETRVRNLPSDALAQFRVWFHAYENEVWDRQIEADYKAGKFDKLIDEARKEFAQGKVREM
ncbi:MAG TPA: hypothetical protein VGZ47_06560 [Gemmataceae bacterium]|jgi:hypothetical protein|nr:hypothetical protein [Gemmataceae bacterium]